MKIEAEVRSFISKKKYAELLDYFKRNGELLSEDQQESHYFDDEGNLRIQKNNFFSKIWFKKGKMHDEKREEIEIKAKKEDFQDLERLFLNLGFAPKIKWFRKRHTFRWQGVSAMVDYTRGYGYIIELEKLCKESEANSALKMLNKKMRKLNVEITPKKEFDKRYAYYKENWRKLTESK